MSRVVFPAKREPRTPRVKAPPGSNSWGRRARHCVNPTQETCSLTSHAYDGTGALPEAITARRLTAARHPPRHPKVITLSDRRRSTRVPRQPGLGGLQGTTVPSSRLIHLPSTHDRRRPRRQWVEAAHRRVEPARKPGRTAAPTVERRNPRSHSSVKWHLSTLCRPDKTPPTV
jgi:hypothetical protein